MKNQRRDNFRGLTLIEVVVASALFGTVILFTISALQSSFFAAETTSIQSGLENSATSAMDLMARELKDGGTKYANFAIATSQQSITFARCIGYSNKLPVFGNRITYAVVTYDGKTCLERTEVVNGVEQKQILTDQLFPTSVAVKTANDVTINVSGANFQMLSGGIVTVTLVLAKSNYILKENTTVVDDRMIVTSQTCVHMVNS